MTRASPEASDAWVGPLKVEVGDGPRHEHEIDRTIADNLVSDVDIAAHGVARLGRHACAGYPDARAARLAHAGCRAAVPLNAPRRPSWLSRSRTPIAP